jgi:hypothetical protein
LSRFGASPPSSCDSLIRLSLLGLLVRLFVARPACGEGRSEDTISIMTVWAAVVSTGIWPNLCENTG